MKATVNREKVIAATATILLFISCSTAIYYSGKKKSLEKGLTEQKIKSEHLLSEKLALAKEIEKIKGELVLVKGTKTALDKKANELYSQLSQKEAELSKMKITAGNIASLQKKVNELKLAKQSLEGERMALNNRLTTIEDKNEELARTIDKLKSENKLLADNLELLSSMTADNFRIETRKEKKERLTIIARNTKKMTVSFDVPQNVVSDVGFKIITPDGKTISSKDDSGISYVVHDEEILYASAQVNAGDIEITKRIEMTYKPKEKMKPGIYKIEILNDNKRISTCQVNLR